jgi:hypothetical protein
MRRVFIFQVRAPVYPTELRLADVHGERGAMLRQTRQVSAEP